MKFEDCRGLKEAVFLEVFTIVLAMVAAIAELWGVFAALSLSCLLVPLWVMAISAVVITFNVVDAEKTEGDK